MTVRVECPNCRKSYHVPDANLGRTGRCKTCGQSFTLSLSSAEHNGRGDRNRLPKTIGPYRVRRKLGAGAMGEVFLAHDPMLDREIAIKVVKGALAEDATLRERFLREARLAARLHHTHAVTVYTAGEADGQLYVAMEYVNGRSLEHVVGEDGPLPWRTATRAVREAAEGLAAAHALGIIHRDIKPANLLYTAHGLTKVADFGLARELVASVQFTQQGMIVGTPAYMAPEQWTNAAVDARADIYALACTYFFLLTGQRPFQADSLHALGYQHCNESFPDPREWKWEISDVACRVIERGSQKSPDQRYPSAVAMAEALREVLTVPPQILNGDDRLRMDPSFGGTTLGVPGTAPSLRGPGAVSSAVATVTEPPTRVQLVRDNNEAPVSAVAPDPVRRRANEPPRFRFYATAGVAILAVVTSVLGSGIFRSENAPPPEPETGVDSTWTNSIGMELAYIPAGAFMMGSPSGESDRDGSELAHWVRITQPFRLGVYEVTQREFQQIMGRSPSYFSADGGGKDRVPGLDTSRFPVETVTWYDAVAFCNKLSEKENLPAYYSLRGVEHGADGTITDATVRILGGSGYRLPTEAEWEYACRAGTATPFHFGFQLNGGDANIDGDHPYGTTAKGPDLQRTTKAGSYRPNGFGLYDIHGNVGEWCQDWYDEVYYAGSPSADPQGPATGTTRVLRGGSWMSLAGFARSANRGFYGPAACDHRFGFRAARTP